MEDRSKAIVLSGLLFLGVYLCGFFLSAGKPLWLDEHYSLTKSITGVSYTQILHGKLPWEGNNCPFFYTTQKLLCDLVAYDIRQLIPIKPPHGPIFYGDPFSNTYLRLISIFFMALAPAALFYYFSRRYSLKWGSFSALLCLSSWLFWWYGLEARPYIHFMTLTTLQAIVFIEMARHKEAGWKLWACLSGINILLALTSVSSVLQIVLIGAWFAVFSRHELSWRKVFSVFIVPMMIIFYYYSVASKGRSWFSVPIYKYYISNVPWDVLAVIVVFLVYAGISWFSAHKVSSSFARGLTRDEIKETAPMAFFAVALSLACFASLIFFKMNELPLAQGGAPFAHRHLINLMPIGIMAMTVFSRTLLRSLKDEETKLCFITLLAAILVWRFAYTYFYVHSWIGI